MPPKPITVDTPRGLARVVWAGWRNGLKVVCVKFLDTGSPWSFERRQVTEVR